MNTELLTPNYEAIIEDATSLECNRKLAYSILRTGYCNPGNFFSTISDDELKSLVDGIDDADTFAQSEVVLMTLMLASAEGVNDITQESMEMHTKVTLNFLMLESLYRKGLIEIWRDNYSYLTVDKKIAQIKNS
jgi:hypothetical protein